MYLVDYHTHPCGHGQDINIDELKKFIEQAQNMNIKEIGFSDHDWVLDKINWDNLKQLKDKFDVKIRIGLEVDYRPEQDKKIEKMLKDLPLDYCIGSVHHIGDWCFDHPDYIDEYSRRNVDDVYQQYFDILRQAVLSGLFDIVGHLDLIKVFGFYPEKVNILELVDPVLQVIKDKDMVVEINSNGLNKPVGEIYPAKTILRRVFKLGIDVTLGSDAHTYKRVGEGIKDIAGMLKNIGFKSIVSFNKRRKTKVDF